MALLICALSIVLIVFCSYEDAGTPFVNGVVNNDFSSFYFWLHKYNFFDQFFMAILISTVFLSRRSQKFFPISIALLCAAIYFVGHSLLTNFTPLISTPFSYHGIIQTALVLVAAYLTTLIARRCTGFDDLVRSLFVPGSVPKDFDFERTTDKARFILQYCRRNNHAAGVIVIKPDVPVDDEVFPEIVKRLLAEAARSAILLKVAHRVADGLRRTDVLVPLGKNGKIAVICPETDSLHLQAMKRRISDDLSASLSIPLRTGSAHFPEDAATYDGLLEFASSQIEQEGRATQLGSPEEFRQEKASHF